MPNYHVRASITAAVLLTVSGSAFAQIASTKPQTQIASIKPLNIAFGKTPLYAAFDGPKVKKILTIKNAASGGPNLSVALPTSLPPGISLKLVYPPFDATMLFFGPLASQPVEVDYSPTKDGVLSGSLIFTTNDPKHRQVKVHVTGRGVGKPPNVRANPPTAIFLGDADSSDNVYTDYSGHSGDAAIGPGPIPNSPHYGGVTIPLAYPLPGHQHCDGSFTDNPGGVFGLFPGLVVGGGGYSNGAFISVTSDVEAYDPCTKSFSNVGKLPTAVAWPAITTIAAAISGYDHFGNPQYAYGYALAGGIDANGEPSRQVTVIWQDRNTGAVNIEAGPLLSTGRVYASAFGSGETATGNPDRGEFLVAGGIDSTRHVSGTFETVCGTVGGTCFSDIGGTGKLISPRAGAVGGTSLVGSVGGDLVGGVDDNGNVLSSTEEIIPTSNPSNGTMYFASQPGPRLTVPRAFASSPFRELSFWIGGLSGVAFSANLSIVPTGPALSSTELCGQAGPPLNIARALAGLAYVFSTSVPVLIVAGGIDGNGLPLNSIEIQRNALEPADPGYSCPILSEPFVLLPGTTTVGHPAPLALTPDIPGFF